MLGSAASEGYQITLDTDNLFSLLISDPSNITNLQAFQAVMARAAALHPKASLAFTGVLSSTVTWSALLQLVCLCFPNRNCRLTILTDVSTLRCSYSSLTLDYNERNENLNSSSRCWRRYNSVHRAFSQSTESALQHPEEAVQAVAPASDRDGVLGYLL